MAKKQNTEPLTACTKINPYPAWLRVLTMDEKTAREKEALGLTSACGTIITVELCETLTRPRAVPIIAHECEHVIDDLEEIIGDGIKGETRCYLLGWLVEYVFGVFCAWKKR